MPDPQKHGGEQRSGESARKRHKPQAEMSGTGTSSGQTQSSAEAQISPYIFPAGELPEMELDFVSPFGNALHKPVN